MVPLDGEAPVAVEDAVDADAGRGTPPAGRGTRFEWSIPADKWAKMSAAEKQTHIDKVKVQKAAALAKQTPEARAAYAALHAPPPPIPAAVAPPPSTVSVMTTPTAAPGLRSMLSNVANSDRVPNDSDTISVNGHTYRFVTHTNIMYRIQNFVVSQSNPGSLIDGGANGGFAGADCRLIECTADKADVSGIGDASHQRFNHWHCCWSDPNNQWSHHWYLPPVCLPW